MSHQPRVCWHNRHISPSCVHSRFTKWCFSIFPTNKESIPCSLPAITWLPNVSSVLLVEITSLIHTSAPAQISRPDNFVPAFCRQLHLHVTLSSQDFSSWHFREANCCTSLCLNLLPWLWPILRVNPFLTGTFWWQSCSAIFFLFLLL